MAADKEIMRQIEALRLDRPGRIHQAALEALDLVGAQLDAGLRALAATYREEAELWERSGAKGWKSSAADAALIAQAVDSVAAQLDNAGGGAALSISVPERPSTAGVAAHAFEVGPGGTGAVCTAMVERDGSGDSCGLPYSSIVHVAVETPTTTSHERLDALVASAVAEGRGMLRVEVGPTATGVTHDVTAYLKGDDSAMSGALTPSSVLDAGQRAKLDSLTDHPIPVTMQPDCCVHMLEPDEDPAPWCDCRDDDDMARGHAGPCKRQAHLRQHHDIPAEQMPKTWETDTMTADGFRPPGQTAALAPPLGQPGDNSGGGYSHSYVPPGGRKVTFAELLTPVPAASLPPHLSHSQGNTIGDCATQYRLQRVEQLPQVPQWANIGGTAFHAAVEHLERMVVANPAVDLKGIDVELTWKFHFSQTIEATAMSSAVPQSVWRASRKGAEGEAWWWVNGPKFLRAYLDARPDEPTMDIPVYGVGGIESVSGIEADLTIDVPTNWGPIPLNAKLDRVTAGHVPGHPKVGALIIRDYKTSYERPTDTTQLGDYAHVLRATLARVGGPIAEVPIYGSYFDARRGTWTEPVDLLQAHPFEALQYRITTQHAQKRALTTGPTPARPSSFCGGCSVRYACPIMASKT